MCVTTVRSSIEKHFGHIWTLVCPAGVRNSIEKHFVLLRSQSFLELALVNGAS